MPTFFRFLLALFLALPLSLVETTPAALAAPLAWELVAPLSGARENHTTTLLSDGRVLVTGGDRGVDTYLNSAALYDPFSGRWSAAAAMHHSRTGHTATLLPNGKVLVAGGRGLIGSVGVAAYLTSAEVYDPALNSWTLLTDTLQAPRQFHTATLLGDGRVLLVGGQTGTLTFTASAETFDPTANSFTPTGSLSGPERRDHTATRLPDGRVLVVGGFTGSIPNPTYTTSAYLFDPNTNTFGDAAPISSARARHTATLLNNGQVLVTGGRYYLINATAYHNTSYFYDPSANSWTAAAALPNARADHSASLLPNGRLLISGGTNGSALADCQLYDPNSNAWAQADALNQSRYRHTALLLPSGSLLALGGYDGANARASVERFDPANGRRDAGDTLEFLSTPSTATVLPNGRVLVTGIKTNATVRAFTELYDPQFDVWSVHASLNSARENNTATLLPDGRVLVAGGDNGSSTLLSTEIYDPVQETWSPAASMPYHRSDHTATLLADGRVLVVSGFSRHTVDKPGVDSAEIYHPRSNTWSFAGSPAQPRLRHKALLLPDGRVMIAGGQFRSSPTGFQRTASVEFYDPATGLWSPGAPLGSARDGFTLNLLPDGRVLAVGGETASGYLDAVERYDPALDTWTALTPLPSPRAGHSATLMADGRLLIAGGLQVENLTTNYRDEYLVFDPATALMTLATDLNRVRAGHQAVLLPNGRVFLIAGATISSADNGSTELYTSGIGFSPAWRPKITGSSTLSIGQPLVLNGERFLGNNHTEASGGGPQNASSGQPLVLLYSLGNSQVQWLNPDPDQGFGPTRFTSIPLEDFPQGPAYAIVFTNGIASEPLYLSAGPPQYQLYLPLVLK